MRESVSKRLVCLIAAATMATAPVAPAVGAPDKGKVATSAESMSVSTAPGDYETIGVTDKEVLIGSSLPLTSTLQERARQISQGADAYIRYINDQGGVHGRQIKLLTYDDQYEGQKAAEIFEKNLKGKVFAGAFFTGTVCQGKYIQLADACKMPLLGSCSGNPLAYRFHPTEFTFRPSLTDEVTKQVDELWEHGIRKIGIIYQLDAYGLAIKEGLARALQRHGSTVVSEGVYHRQSADIEEAYAQVKAGAPEAVILGATAGAVRAAIKKRKDENWKVLFLSISSANDYIREMGNEANGAMATEVVPIMDDRQPAVALYHKVTAKYWPGVKPNLGGFESFLNAMLLVEGLKRAGKDLTRTKFIRALESLGDYDLGLDKKYRINYSAQNHNALSPAVIAVSVFKDGQLVPTKDADWKPQNIGAKL